MHKVFEQEVATRYHLYNSLFLNLPFDNIYQTGTLLPLLQQHAAKCFDEGKDPVFIIHEFFNNYTRGYLLPSALICYFALFNMWSGKLCCSTLLRMQRLKRSTTLTGTVHLLPC